MTQYGAPGLRHSFWTGPWHYCDRCDRKTKIKTMKWERGLLLCVHCQDTNTISGPGLRGERDVKIAQVLMDGKEELVPVDKLRHPDFAEDLEDFIL